MRVSPEEFLELQWSFAQCCPVYKAEHGNVTSRGKGGKMKFDESRNLINANVLQKPTLHGIGSAQYRTCGVINRRRSVFQETQEVNFIQDN